jgi:hypothetical protein
LKLEVCPVVEEERGGVNENRKGMKPTARMSNSDDDGW